MDCKNFGIGLIVLSTTLFLGITIGENLRLNESLEIGVAEENVLTLEEAIVKDCVPDDPNLKYHFIGEDETKTVSVKVKNVEQLKKLIDKSEIDSKIEKQLKKTEKGAETYNSTFQTLVFTQKCRSEKKSQ